MGSRRVALICTVLVISPVLMLWALSPQEQVSAGDDWLPVSSANSAGSIALTVRVAVANRAPVLSVSIPLGAESVPEGGHLEYGLAAEDPDGTVPSLIAVGLLKNSVLVDSGNGNGVLVFNPASIKRANTR